MISISTFKAFPELPELGLSNGISLELNKLVDPTHYPIEFLNVIKNSQFNGKYISAHGPFFDLIPPSIDNEIRTLCLSKFKRAIEACQYLGITNLILHTGWIDGLYNDDVWIERSILFWKEVVSFCNRITVIHIENVFEKTPRLLKEIIKGVDSEYCKICLDIGHINLLPNSDIEFWINELYGLIGHLHIHNNFGKEDNHNGLNQGNIDMNRILKVIKEKCSDANWNLEIKSCFQESIDIIKSV